MKQRKRQTHRPPSGNSKTVQHAAVGTSVREIVERTAKGTPVGGPAHRPQTPLFFEMPSQSFHDMMNQVTKINMAFQALSARTKGKFWNSPYTMLQWLEDPNNRKEGLRLGLLRPTEEEAQEVAREAAKARRVEQIDIIREAMKTPPAPPQGGATA